MNASNDRRLGRAIAIGVATVSLAFAGVLASAPSATAHQASGKAPTVTALSGSPATWARATAPAYTPPSRMLRVGTRGADVRALQQRLTALKYYPGAVDGVFGSSVLEAVWAFQEVQGLHVDGVVGPATARALASPRAYASHYPSGGALRVEINLRTRVLVLYRGGKVALISHISAGGGYLYRTSGGGWARAVTPTGRFRTTAFLPGWITVPLGRMYDSVFFIGTRYAIHGEYNADVPLNPASHGCVRIPIGIAQFFHTLVPTPGTPVYIY
jgi:lipoprotein-anchoring transpeptidase ErfK/SrfK